ncbi:hypothetical protein [Pontixanthobacter sp.]|uniref:hypothetical protein n=1 Tax=Pontixanthobacter sp. TaxID=2792078 RepID=UPI003C7E636F
MKTLSLAACCITLHAAQFALPVSARTPDATALTLEQRTSLRCSAAFAIIADRQAKGNPQALEYPALAERGREFFVRSSARLMDDTGMDRTRISALIQSEALNLSEQGMITPIMPSCLLLLEASGI